MTTDKTFDLQPATGIRGARELVSGKAFTFRRTLAWLGFAEMLVAPTFKTWQVRAKNEATNQRFCALPESRAQESGHVELRFAPVIPMGHSALARFPVRVIVVASQHGCTVDPKWKSAARVERTFFLTRSPNVIR